MSFNSILSIILPIIVLIAFGIIVYSGIKKQSVKETMDEIKEKIRSFNNG